MSRAVNHTRTARTADTLSTHEEHGKWRTIMTGIGEEWVGTHEQMSDEYLSEVHHGRRENHHGVGREHLLKAAATVSRAAAASRAECRNAKQISATSCEGMWSKTPSEPRTTHMSSTCVRDHEWSEGCTLAVLRWLSRGHSRSEAQAGG